MSDPIEQLLDDMRQQLQRIEHNYRRIVADQAAAGSEGVQNADGLDDLIRGSRRHKGEATTVAALDEAFRAANDGRVTVIQREEKKR